MSDIDPLYTTPVGEADPCGPDCRWDPDFLDLVQSFDAATERQDDTVVDAQVASSDSAGFDAVVEKARALTTRTKDLRVLAIHAMASWHDAGLAAFADAMEGLVRTAETWPDQDAGVHPRADAEDGDLSERAAPVGRLLNAVPALDSVLGWGTLPGVSERDEIAAVLRGVFEAWSRRLEPAFGRDLPLCTNAWKALSKRIGGVSDAGAEADTASEESAPVSTADAWDVIEHAAQLMLVQDRHSPALPVLHMIAGWRSLDIMSIAQQMKTSGVGLEQLLESVRKQLAAK